MKNNSYLAPFIFFLLALFSMSCSDNDLPDYYRLGKLRVLGIGAEPPEVNPLLGTPVTITPLVSDLEGNGRRLEYRLEACLDPGVALGAQPGCGHDPTAISRTGSFALTSPQFTGPVTLANNSLSVPVTVFAGQTEQNKFNGVPYIIVFTVTASNGDTVTSFRRILASTRTTANRSPVILGIQKDGTNLTTLPSVGSVLKPNLGDPVTEIYPTKREDLTQIDKTETITLTWFVSDGELKYARTDANSGNDWTPPSSSTHPLFLFVIARDDRGGLGYLTRPVGP